jgi:hypothetical protein
MLSAWLQRLLMQTLLLSLSDMKPAEVHVLQPMA